MEIMNFAMAYACSTLLCFAVIYHHNPVGLMALLEEYIGDKGFLFQMIFYSVLVVITPIVGVYILFDRFLGDRD